jgi:chromosome segregation ATPase
MSQSETLMLIVFGFAVATFLALIVGRLAWKLAVRIGARRVQQNVPVTVVDLQNDRDRLRAEQAILSRKIEVRLDEMKLRMAEQAAEVNRNRNRVETLMQQISEQDRAISERDTEIARLNAMAAGLQRELANVKNAGAGLEQTLRARDVEMASLQEKFLTKLDEARTPAPAPVLPSVEEANARLTSRIREITSISNELSGSKQQPSDGNVNTADVTERIFVKPADTQQIHSKPKAKTPRKATRSAAKLEAAVEQDHSVSPETEETGISQIEEASPAVQAASEAAAAEPAAEAPATQKTVTNVISLAQRIKALQREIAG